MSKMKGLLIPLNNLSNIKGYYGCVDRHNQQSVFLQLNGWMSFDLPSDIDQRDYLEKFEGRLRKFINARGNYVHSLAMYSFSCIEISESLMGELSNESYFSIELTVIFKKPLEDLKENKELEMGVYRICNEILGKIEEFKEITVTKYSSKKESKNPCH